jgi:hypothetical protein
MLIRRIKKICKECNTKQYIFSKGRCKYCASKSYKKPKRVSEKQKSAKKTQSNRRSKYFDYHIEHCTHCEESGVAIPYPSRLNVCHLVDKGRHPSVEDNLDNCVYLTGDLHTEFDNLLFKHRFEEITEKFKNSHEIIWKKFKKVLPLVQEQTRFKIELEKYLENYG